MVLIVAHLAIIAANGQSTSIACNVWFLLIAHLAIIAVVTSLLCIITSNVWFLLIAQLAIIAANVQATIMTSSVVVRIES